MPDSFSPALFKKLCRPKLLGILGVLMPSLSFSQDASTLIDKVQRLERQLSTLERQVYRGEVKVTSAPLTPGAPNTSSVFASSGQSAVNYSASEANAMEKQIQQLTENLEETSHEVTVLKKEFQTFKSDVEFRLSEIEKNTTNISKKTKEEPPMSSEKETIKEFKKEKKGETKGTKKPSESQALSLPGELSQKTSENSISSPALPSTPKEMPTGSAAEQYNTSLDLLKKKEYGPALKGFEAFLSNHASHELAGNAQFWLGEAHDALGDYTKASVAYLNAYKNYPENSKRAESLLKLGQSLGKLGKTKEACATFQKLLTDFSKVSDTIKQAAQDALSKNQCS